MVCLKKKLLILLASIFLGVFFVACSDGGSFENGDPEDSQSEMTQKDALEYFEQITYRLVESWENEDGSFEQRSSLQAAIGRSESVMEEINEKYEDIPLLEVFEEISSYVRLGAKEGLDEGFVYIEIYLGMIKEELEIISDEHLGGEMPPSIQRFEPTL